jgi:hypothetical protein
MYLSKVKCSSIITGERIKKENISEKKKGKRDGMYLDSRWNELIEEAMKRIQ